MQQAPSPKQLREAIRDKAQTLGFDWVGFAAAGSSQTHGFYQDWLQQGYAGEMGYLHKHSPVKADLHQILPGVKTVVSLACNYNTARPKHRSTSDPSRGRFSRYAQGDDYHLVLRERLEQLRAWILETTKSTKFEETRVYVDTGPILEREWAWRAGLGWFGKHSNLIHPKLGSWLLLAELLITLDLPPDEPFTGIDCGSCTRCLRACPTEAIVADRTVDARRCLSYLTIELKSEIPAEFRSQVGNWIFGCDICQEVCPWNRKAPVSHDPVWQARPEIPDRRLWDWVRLSPDEFSQVFRRSSVKRTKRRGLLRNVVVALGGIRHPQARSALRWSLQDPEPLVRLHAVGALVQHRHRFVSGWLRDQLRQEADSAVCDALRQALQRTRPSPLHQTRRRIKSRPQPAGARIHWRSRKDKNHRIVRQRLKTGSDSG